MGFEAFEWKFEAFESYWKDSNANSNHSKGFRSILMQYSSHSKGIGSIRIQIRTIRNGFEAFECKFEPFQRDLKGSNSNSNHSKGIRSIRMQIRTIRKGFEGFKCKF